MLCVGALFVVKTAKLYFTQIQFSGRKNKSSQKLENEREKCLKILPLLGRLCYNDTCSWVRDRKLYA